MGIVVIGAGAAGCVVAATLAERGFDVTIVEAGSGGARPPALDSMDHLGAAEAGRWWWPDEPRRGRGLGGSSAVNGMVLDGIDPRDADRWGWTDVEQHQAAVLERIGPVTAPQGPLTEAVGLAVADECPAGPPTAISGASGWLPLSLAADGRQRRSAADVFLADPSSHLAVRAGVEAVRIEPGTVFLADGTSLDAEHVVVAAGAVGSPSLLVGSGLIDPSQVDPAANHPSTVLVAELAPALRREPGEGIGPSSRLVRTGATPGTGPDLQMLVLDHTGSTATGRSHGAVIVSAMDPDRPDVLSHGVERARAWLGEIPGVEGVTVGDDRSPVHHHCCTLSRHLSGGTSTVDLEGVSVVDASSLPTPPRTNPMLAVMVAARRWASGFTR